MKKSLLNLLGLVLAFSALFVSCAENNGGKEGGTTGILCEINIIASEGGNVQFKDNSDSSPQVYAGTNITIIATPNNGYAFVGWFVGNSNEPVSTEATYTFTVEENWQLVAKFKKVEQAINGHEYVDLGLPSGLKWATCNVGAAYPEDYGGYYAWGEIEEKEYYHWSTYKYCYLDEKRNYSMTKYCLESNYGIVDSKRVLDPEDDVAHVKWGGTWRMPTYEDFDELCEICTSKWITQNGVKGRIFTGPNGNSIFLPAAGYNVDEVYLEGGIGYYWSNSLTGGRTLGDYSNKACSLDLTRSTLGCDANSRDWGYSVRPVTE